MTQPTRFHGIGPYNPEDGLAIKSKTPTPPSWQKVFGDTMLKLCKRDEKIVGITAAMPSGTGLDILARERPQQYIDVGIAEETCRCIRLRPMATLVPSRCRVLLLFHAARLRFVA
jgi:deoxyxylulose-5-phosphate synthase